MTGFVTSTLLPTQLSLENHSNGVLYLGPAKYYHKELVHPPYSIDTVVSFLEEPDAFLSPSLEGRIYLISFPIPDYSVPSSMRELHALIQTIGEELDKGKRIYMHCQAGLGRTGTVAACVILENESISAAEAIKKIRALRPGSIENREQYQFVQGYAQQYGQNKTGDRTAPDEESRPMYDSSIRRRGRQPMPQSKSFPGDDEGSRSINYSSQIRELVLNRGGEDRPRGQSTKEKDLAEEAMLLAPSMNSSITSSSMGSPSSSVVALPKQENRPTEEVKQRVGARGEKLEDFDLLNNGDVVEWMKRKFGW